MFFLRNECVSNTYYTCFCWVCQLSGFHQGVVYIDPDLTGFPFEKIERFEEFGLFPNHLERPPIYLYRPLRASISCLLSTFTTLARTQNQAFETIVHA